MRQVIDLQRMPRCKRTFTKRYARTNKMRSTLDDRRNDRHEKSKQHTHTKIDKDTRRVARRVRAQGQPILLEHAPTQSETQEPRETPGHRCSCTCANRVCVTTSNPDALTTRLKFKFQYSQAQLHLLNQPNAFTAATRWNRTTLCTVPDGVLGGHFADEVLVHKKAQVV